jgi:uncharacterized coiled-coil protein SlyX
MKEERKKFQEDAKVLKKQLHQLTLKFEELKQSAKQMSEARAAGVVGGGPTTDYIISDLKVQLVTTSQQLSQGQDEVRLLKSKLKECAVQLKVILLFLYCANWCFSVSALPFISDGVCAATCCGYKNICNTV